MMKQIMRVKQLADQTFSRSSKPEEIADELPGAERRVEQMKSALQVICKRLGSGSSSVAQAQDPAAREKRLKKIPEYNLGLALKDNNFKDDSLFKRILQECGTTEIELANEIANHEYKVEKNVLNEFNSVNEEQIPNIAKAKKNLTKCINDRESANNRYHSLLRQNDLHPQKVNQAKLELEEADTKAEQARDNFAIEMFNLLSDEMKFVNLMVEYLKLQREYHENALNSLTDIVPRLEKCIDLNTAKPMFGQPIEEHLRVTNRTIAYPIELCVCALYELGLNEEGLLRIAGGNTRTKRLKFSLNSGMFSLPLLRQYRDVHILAGVLKSYLRELPEPLLTFHLYESFVSAIANNYTEENRLNALWKVVYQLPEANLNNLRYLIKFLSALTKNQTVNKMTPTNIAIVVAPNLLRSNSMGGEKGFNMMDTTTINCVVELLVKHCDWFFNEEVNFFMTFTKENLLPDLYEDGFTPNFGQGIDNKSFNPNNDASHEDVGMTKSMCEFNEKEKPSVKNTPKQNHSRSNSHDSSLILVDNQFKRAQSNTSLSEQSSPPPDSPKPVAKRKNKPVAPVPPNFFHQDKNKDQSPLKSDKFNSSKSPPHNREFNTFKTRTDNERPDKPPRPVVPDSIKHVTGVQTINRSTYKSKQLNRIGNKLSSSRESLTSISSMDRKNSLETDKLPTKVETTTIETIPVVNCVESIIVQHGTVGKMVVGSDSMQENSPLKTSVGVMTTFQQLKPHVPPPEPLQNVAKLPKPVAAPRTIIPSVKPDSLSVENDINSEVQLRPKSMIDPSTAHAIANKPAIPERPAMLRPSSFRNSNQRNSSLEMLNVVTEAPQNTNNPTEETTLERIHSYTVDKQQPTIINVGPSTRLSDPAILSPEESLRVVTHRTNSTGSGSQAPGEYSENKSFTSQMRKLSQSEGNILDVPPSPRPYHKLPRPQIPAPPPPTAFIPQVQPSVVESTNL